MTTPTQVPVQDDPIHRAGHRLAADLAALCADLLSEGKLAVAASVADQRARLLTTLGHSGDAADRFPCPAPTMAT